jgi:hypothetical protein
MTALVEAKVLAKEMIQAFYRPTAKPARRTVKLRARKRGRAVECSSLENCRGCESSVSSNLTASAKISGFLTGFDPPGIDRQPWLNSCAAQIDRTRPVDVGRPRNQHLRQGRSMPAVCAFFAKLPLAFALVSGFSLRRPVAQSLRLACLRLFPALFIPKMHISSAQPETDCAANNQQDDA